MGGGRLKVPPTPHSWGRTGNREHAERRYSHHAREASLVNGSEGAGLFWGGGLPGETRCASRVPVPVSGE